jgi:hypothetical protein
MANYGIKITKAGSGITSSDPQDYHFWSKYRNKSIKSLLSLNVTTTTDTDSDPVVNSFEHGFGYIPQFMAFVTNDINSVYVNCDYGSTVYYGKDGEMQTEELKAWATSSRIYVSANNYHFVPGSGTWTGIANTYTFDIVLFMEEIETA